MPDRAQLVAYWRTRLNASQEQVRAGSPHLRWLRRMYIRVYQFLLSQYGEQEHGEYERGNHEYGGPAFNVGDAQGEAADLAEAPSRMPLVDNTPDHFGQPPKAPGKIQAVLKDIHNANDRLDKPGPLKQGLPPGAWLAVASRRERWIPAACLKHLHRHGVCARVASLGDDLVVEVLAQDFAAACALLRKARPWLMYAKQSRAERHPWLLFLLCTFTGLGLGFVAGAFLAAVTTAQGGETKPMPMIWGLFILSGLLSGVFAGLHLTVHLRATRTARRTAHNPPAAP